MNQKVKNWISFVVRLALSVGLLAVLFLNMDQKDKLIELIRTADVVYIVYAFIPFVIIHYLLIVRWRLLINALGLDIPWINMARYFFLGLFGNLFLPTAIGGDVIKTVGLCVHAEQKPRIVASVVLDRLSGFAAMVVVSFVGLVFGFRYLNHPMAWLLVVLMGMLLTGIGCVLFNEKLYRFFCQAFYFFPKLKNAVMQMHYDIALLKNKKIAIVKAVAVSCCSQVLLALTFFLLAKALQQQVGLFYFIIFTPMACIASSFPSIGGLGFREGMLEFLLVNIGVISGIGVSIGLFDFLFMVIVGVAGWLLFMLTKDRRTV